MSRARSPLAPDVAFADLLARAAELRQLARVVADDLAATHAAIRRHPETAHGPRDESTPLADTGLSIELLAPLYVDGVVRIGDLAKVRAMLGYLRADRRARPYLSGHGLRELEDVASSIGATVVPDGMTWADPPASGLVRKDRR